MGTTSPETDLDARMHAAVRGFYAWLGSLLLLGIAPIAALRLMERHTLAFRVAGVLVGVGGMLPWMWIVGAMIWRSDEYERRIQLIALGLSFAAALALLVTLAMLVRAEFLEPPDLLVVWVALLVIWGAALMGAKRYFERAA